MYLLDNFMWNVFPIIFCVMFVVILGSFLYTAVRGARQWHQNNQSPRLTVEAKVVAKRADVMHHHHHNDDMDYSTHSTTYYATFEVESGDRMELVLSGTEYGQLAEGDVGRLHFQGTRYLGFERKRD